MWHHAQVSASAPARVSTFAPLRVRSYRLLWSVLVLSNLGTFLQMVAAPWLMLELTGSPLMVSLVTASLALPRLLLTLPAGALADAIDRRILLMIGQWGSALAVALLAVLTWQGGMTPGTLLVLTFALGVGSAVSVPAHQTLVPDLVPREMVPAAVSLNSAGFNVARAVGPAIGGAFVAAGAADVAFGLNAVSYIVVALTLIAIPPVGTADTTKSTVWRSTRAGLRYVRFTGPMMVIIGVAAVFALTAASIQTLLPNVVADDLGMDASGFGLLLGTFGAGALVAALTTERIRSHVRHLLPFSIVGFGISGVVFGLSRMPLLSAAALAVAGLCWVWALTTMNATVQLMAPRWVRGRAMSIYLLAVLGVQPFGAVVSGAIAEEIGSATTVALLTGMTLVLGLYAMRMDRLPVLGDVVEPTMPEDWTVPDHAADLAGSPVLVQTTWHIDLHDAEQFFDAMREVRRHRLRTGAERWSIFRDADHPERITEIFQVHSWPDHLAQHQRLDQDAAEALRLARAFDQRGGPVTRHLVGLDLLDPDAPPIAEMLLAQHSQMHDLDGSVPLVPDDEAAVDRR